LQKQHTQTGNRITHTQNEGLDRLTHISKELLSSCLAGVKDLEFKLQSHPKKKNGKGYEQASFSLLCWVWGALWHLQKFLQYIKYIILEFTHPPFSFILPSPIPGIVSTDIIFPFIYMCTLYLLHIHPPSPFPASSLKKQFSMKEQIPMEVQV
jgi:hypothetical protein